MSGKKMPLEGVKKWFLENQREFPWRTNRTPYRVWVAEVMLQQTRAEVVIGYYNRWMARFPSLEELALSEEDEVVKMWEGLGYYSRARNLHLGAKQIKGELKGIFPNSYETLQQVKGIGPYTAAAIVSFAFGQKAPALDGNVMRVLARFLGFEKDVIKHAPELRLKLYEMLPDEMPHIAMEGLIELGALVCQRNPKCSVCPLNNGCKAFKENQVERFPIKPLRRQIVEIHRFVSCITYEEEVLVGRVEGKEIMKGLWEFPYLQMSKECIVTHKWEDAWGLSPVQLKVMTKQKGHFTHHRAYFYPVHYAASLKKEVVGFQWIQIDCLGKLPFSSAHRKIANELCINSLRCLG